MTLGQESQFDQCGSQPAVLFRLFHCHAAHWGAFFTHRTVSATGGSLSAVESLQLILDGVVPHCLRCAL